MKRKRDWSSEEEEEEEEESNGVEAPLAILWDIDNCCIPSGLSPDIVADNTRKYLRKHGVKAPIMLFSAYGDFSKRSSSCQWSGVNLIHVSNSKKDAADKAILVDMLLFAMDNPPPSSILLISGDVDFAPALHKLAQRGHSILVATTNLSQTSYALLSAAKFVWEWPQMASNGNFPTQNQTQSLPNGNYSETIRKSNPTLSMQVSSKRPNNCGLLAETASKPSLPASLIQNNLEQSDIDVVKEEILSLIHRKGGSITLGEIPLLYQRTFKKILDRKRCGCKLKSLLEKMGDDIHMHGHGNKTCVYLISQGKCLCLQSNVNSNTPNQKNVTGHGLPSETKIELNGTDMMQPSEIEVGDCGLPSQITTKPYPISSVQPCNISPSACGLPCETTKPQSTSMEQPSTNRPSDLEVVKKELLTLLSRYRSGIRLSKIESIYKEIFKKELHVKLRTVLQGIGNDIYMQNENGRCKVILRTQQAINKKLAVNKKLAPKNELLALKEESDIHLRK